MPRLNNRNCCHASQPWKARYVDSGCAPVCSRQQYHCTNVICPCLCWGQWLFVGDEMDMEKDAGVELILSLPVLLC